MHAIRSLPLALAVVTVMAGTLAAQPPAEPMDPVLQEMMGRQARECRPPGTPRSDYPKPGTREAGPATLRAYTPHPYRVTGSTDPQVSVREVVISEDGCLIAIHRSDRVLDVWSNREGRRIVSRPDTDWGYERTGMAFSPDGSVLAIAGQGGLLKVYDAANGALLAEFDGRPHIDPAVRREFGPDIDQNQRSVMASVAFSPDNRRLVTTGNFGTVIVWDLAERRARWARRMEPETPEPLTPGGNAVFTRDGQHVVMMGEQRMQVLSAATGEILQPFPVSSGLVPFDADGPLEFTYSGPEEMAASVDWPGLAVMGSTRAAREGGQAPRLRWVQIVNRHQLSPMYSFRIPEGFRHIAIRPEGGSLAGMRGDTVRVYSVTGTPEFVISPDVVEGAAGRVTRVLFGVAGRMYTLHEGPIPLLTWDLSPI